jgi:lipopolysaccharide export system permease protein
MSILTRYIASAFLKNLIFTGLALVALVLVANFFGQIEQVFSSWEAVLNFLDDSLRSIPFIVEQSQPIVVLLAAMFTFSGLSRSAELTAMKVAGGGPWRLLRPFVLVLLPVAALAYWNQNYLYAMANPPGRDASGEEPERHLWRRIGEAIYYFDRLERAERTTASVRAFRFRKDPFRIAEYDRIRSAALIQDGWLLSDLTRRRLLPDERFDAQSLPRVELTREEFPDVFRPMIADARHMPFIQLYQEIRRLQSEGQRVAVYLLEWYQKPAAMFALGVMALIGIALVQSSPRRGRVGLEASMTILLGVMFWLMSEMSFLLGKGELIPSLLAVWAPHVLFLAAALILYQRMF